MSMSKRFRKKSRNKAVYQNHRLFEKVLIEFNFESLWNLVRAYLYWSKSQSGIMSENRQSFFTSNLNLSLHFFFFFLINIFGWYLQQCTKVTQGCRCESGYLRDNESGKCVRPSDCSAAKITTAKPITCGKNEIIAVCGRACERNCEDPLTISDCASTVSILAIAFLYMNYFNC